MKKGKSTSFFRPFSYQNTKNYLYGMKTEKKKSMILSIKMILEKIQYILEDGVLKILKGGDDDDNNSCLLNPNNGCVTIW